MLPDGVERVEVYVDQLGNAVLAAVCGGRPAFGRVLSPAEQRGAQIDACAIADDGPGVYMPPALIGRYAASHGPRGYVSNEGVFAYGAGCPYLEMG